MVSTICMIILNKIKSLGRKTDRVTELTGERQKDDGRIFMRVKDGSEYELVEDLTTGELEVTGKINQEILRFIVVVMM